MNLAKAPSSTVQILGAEKALFRALKTRHDTPKYGLIFHASLVGQSNPKLKGKVSRMLAAKAALAVRYDALGEESSTELGITHRAKIETRLRLLEEGNFRKISGSGKQLAKWDKYQNKSEVKTYDISKDSTIPSLPVKRKIEEVDSDDLPESKKVKNEPIASSSNLSEKKKKKKKNLDVSITATESSGTESQGPDESVSENPKKKKKIKQEDVELDKTIEEPLETSTSEEGKKKKKKKIKSEPIWLLVFIYKISKGNYIPCNLTILLLFLFVYVYSMGCTSAFIICYWNVIFL